MSSFQACRSMNIAGIATTVGRMPRRILVQTKEIARAADWAYAMPNGVAARIHLCPCQAVCPAIHLESDRVWNKHSLQPGPLSLRSDQKRNGIAVFSDPFLAGCAFPQRS